MFKKDGSGKLALKNIDEGLQQFLSAENGGKCVLELFYTKFIYKVDLYIAFVQNILHFDVHCKKHILSQKMQLVKTTKAVSRFNPSFGKLPETIASC